LRGDHYLVVNVKVKLSLFLTTYHEDVLREWRSSSKHSILRRQMEVSVQIHSPAALPPGIKVSSTHWIEVRVGLKSGLGTLA